MFILPNTVVSNNGFWPIPIQSFEFGEKVKSLHLECETQQMAKNKRGIHLTILMFRTSFQAGA